MKKQHLAKPHKYALAVMIVSGITGFYLIMNIARNLFIAEAFILPILLGLSKYAYSCGSAHKEGPEKEAFLYAGACFGFSTFLLALSTGSTWGITYLYHHWISEPIYGQPMDITLASLNSAATLGIAVWLFLAGILKMTTSFWDEYDKLPAGF